MTDLNRIITRAFEDVKQKWLRPPIIGPEIADEAAEGMPGTAFINLVTRCVTIHPSFVEEIADNMEGPADERLAVASRGLFSHEFGHYQFHPNELSLQLYLSYQAQKIFKENAELVWRLCSDFCNNVLVCSDGLGEELKPVMAAHSRLEAEHPLSAAVFAGYKRFLPDLAVSEDFSAFPEDVRKKMQTAVEQIGGMTIRKKYDLGLQLSQLIRFGDAIVPLIEQKGGIGGGKDSGHGHCGTKQITPDDIKNLPPELREKVEEEMRKLITQLPKEVYDELRKHFLGSRTEPVQGGLGIGFGSANFKPAQRDTVQYYRDAASQFGYYIRPRRQRTLGGVKVPYGNREWKPSDPALDIDTRFSGGLVIPGVTQTRRTEKIPYPATKEVVPRLVLYKDASGSMPDPAEGKCYSTIAGAIFIMSYRKSGAPVGVCVFDSQSTKIFYSTNEDELLAVLSGYKGGGTDVDMKRLKKDLEAKEDPRLRLLSARDRNELLRDPLFRKYLIKDARITTLPGQTAVPTDFVIITDGGIANLGKLVGFLQDNPNYRPTIIHTGGFGLKLEGYDNKTSGEYQGIMVLKADSREDIVNIAKGVVRKNLLAKYTVG